MSDSKKLSNYINEIRAYDIYTLTSSGTGSDEYCISSLPSVSSGGGAANFGNAAAGSVTTAEASGGECDPHIRSRLLLKKLGLQQHGKKQFNNLPVLKEEDGGGLSRSPGASEGPFPGCPERELLVGADDLHADDDDEIDSSSVEDDEDINDDIYPFDDENSCTDESWVDLSKQTSQPSGNSSPFTKVFSSPQGAMSYGSTTPERVTPPPFGNGEEYLRLLREAQKESNQSSARVSLASSRRDTPRDSPKSPPNSPNTEAVLDNEEASVLEGVYINYYNREGDFVRVEKNENLETDWIWDWSSRPDQTPPKQWKFIHPRKGSGPVTRRGASIRRLMVGNSSLFSRDVLYTLLITNVLSLILGTGIGMWLSRKSGGGGGNGSNVPLAIVPIN